MASRQGQCGWALQHTTCLPRVSPFGDEVLLRKGKGHEHVAYIAVLTNDTAGLNFVFGEASRTARCAVFSIARCAHGGGANSVHAVACCCAMKQPFVLHGVRVSLSWQPLLLVAQSAG